MGSLVIGIAALDHETFDDAMKTSAVIKAGLGQLFEIGDRLGRGIGPKLDDHVAFGRLDDGDFVFGRGFGGGDGRSAGSRWCIGGIAAAGCEQEGQ